MTHLPRVLGLALAMGAASVLAACGAARRIPEDEVSEGLPPWMTHGEEVRLDIAKTFLASGNTYSALEIIRQMRSEGYDSPELDLIQGRAMRIDGVVSEAERLLEAARKKMPRDDRAFAELCVLHADEGEVEKAVASCERATALNEGNARAWNNLAFLLLAVDRPQEAGHAAEQAVRLDGADPLFRNNLGLTQVALGRPELAYRTFHSTLPAPEAAFMVGLAVERFEGFDDARPWYVRALDANPTHAGALQKLSPPVHSSTEDSSTEDSSNEESSTEGAEGAPMEEP